jgi:hypothetical protein
VVVRREVWRGRPWAAIPVIVVRDEPELLATYIAEGAPLGFATGDGFPGGDHPWSGKRAWRGPGTLMLQRPDDAHAVFVFWRGAERDFAGWYVNFQAPSRRWADGFDTLDHELDLWVPAGGGGWAWKDRERLEERVADGRFTPAEAAAIHAEGERVAAALDAGRRWWNDAWADWAPDPAWPVPVLRADWAEL